MKPGGVETPSDIYNPCCKADEKREAKRQRRTLKRKTLDITTNVATDVQEVRKHETLDITTNVATDVQEVQEVRKHKTSDITTYTAKRTRNVNLKEKKEC